MIDNHVRREQTLRQLRRVRLAIGDWFTARTADEPARDGVASFAQLHQTRLATLRHVLCSGLRTLDSAACAISVESARDPRAVYAECRSVEQAVLWMERVWLYYAERFDQRRDPVRARLLEAADELIWSCYAAAFANKQVLPAGVARGPAPLAYLDAEYSPATWEVTRLAPAELRHGTDVEGLQTFLKTLPVPVLRLPTWCLGAPWWLVVVAHEVGHNVQRELDLVGAFEELIATAVRGQSSARWRRWSAEIFADIYSVLMLGHWPLRALIELELNEPGRMTTAGGSYPPPAIRLMLMACAADRVGFDGHQAIAPLDLEILAAANAACATDAGLVSAIIDAVLAWMPGRSVSLITLAGTTAQRAELRKLARHWGGTLSQTPPPAAPKPRIDAPRALACGTWQAWETVTGLPTEAERDAALTTLAANAVEIMRVAGPPGTRAGPESTGKAAEAGGVNLARWLLDASRQPVASGTGA